MSSRFSLAIPRIRVFGYILSLTRKKKTKITDYMAFSTFKFNPNLVHCSAHSHSHFTLPTHFHHKNLHGSTSRRPVMFVAFAVHSCPRLLKNYDKETLLDYEDDLHDYPGDEDEDEDEESDEDYLPFDGKPGELDKCDTIRKSHNLAKGLKTKQGKQREPGKGILKSSQTEGSLNFYKDFLDVGHKRQVLETNSGKFSNTAGRPKMRARELMQTRYPQMFDEVDMDAKWIPLLDYLSSFGLKESDFIEIYGWHKTSLQVYVVSARERLDYLMSIGVKKRDIRKVLLRQPQILEFTVNNLKSHVDFLEGLGIPSSRIGKIITNCPSLSSFNIQNSLKPTVRYLIEEVGIEENILCKVVELCPQILTQRIDVSWNTRYMFLSEELGAPRDSIVKMVIRHPQLLHYSIEDGMLPKIKFLRSIGMCNSDILKILTGVTQVLSLSLENNIKPKCMYLVNEVKIEVPSLTKNPTCLSLSLTQRIRPRHRFLVYLKKVPEGPFPVGSLLSTDKSFCHRWAGTSLDKYLEFRRRLLLKEFTNKYKRKR